MKSTKQADRYRSQFFSRWAQFDFYHIFIKHCDLRGSETQVIMQMN